MDAAKIQLSAEEKELMFDPGWILTKNRIQVRVNELLNQVLQALQSWYQAVPGRMPPALAAISPKISRGENYLGLPWYILDFPRLFSAADTCAIRCMFWWGNYFVSSLLLSGNSRNLLEQPIRDSFQLLQDRNYQLNLGSDPWLNEIKTPAYRALKDMSRSEFDKTITELPFIRLSKTLPLQEWDDAADKLFEEAKFLAELLISSRGDETGP